MICNTKLILLFIELTDKLVLPSPKKSISGSATEYTLLSVKESEKRNVFKKMFTFS